MTEKLIFQTRKLEIKVRHKLSTLNDNSETLLNIFEGNAANIWSIISGRNIIYSYI